MIYVAWGAVYIEGRVKWKPSSTKKCLLRKDL